MKKFLTVLLALSVVFTYTVGTAFAAAAPYDTAKYTYSQAMAELENVASKAIKSTSDAMTAALTTYASHPTTYTDASGNGTYSTDAAKAVYQEIYNDAETAIKKQLDEQKTALYEYSKANPNVDEFNINDYVDKINAEILTVAAYTGAADLTDKLSKAEVTIKKADLLKTLNAIDLSVYSKDVASGESKSNYEYASELITKAIAAVEAQTATDSAATNNPVINRLGWIYTPGIGVAEPKGLLYTNTGNTVFGVAFTILNSDGTVKYYGLKDIPTTSGEVVEANKLEYAKAKTLSEVLGYLTADKEKYLDDYTAKLFAENQKANPNATTIADLEEKIAEVKEAYDATVEVVTYLVNNATKVSQLGTFSNKNVWQGNNWKRGERYSTGRPFEDYYIEPSDATYAAGFYAKDAVKRVALVKEAKENAELLKASIGIDGTTVVEIETALENAIDKIYRGLKNDASLGNYNAYENLYHYVEESLIAKSGSTVKVNGITYPAIAAWTDNLTTKYDAAKQDEVEAVQTDAKSAVRAAASVEDANKAFLDAYAKLQAIPTAQQHKNDFTLASGAYTKAYNNAKKEIAAEAAAKIAALEKLGTATGYETYTSGNKLDTLVKQYTDELYTKCFNAEEIAAKLAEAKNEIANLKTDKELAAEATAINTEVAALPNEATTADKDAVLAAYDKVLAHNEYCDLVDSTNKVSYEKVERLANVIENAEAKAITDAINAINKGDNKATLSEKADVEALRTAWDAYVDVWYDYDDVTTLDYDKIEAQVSAFERNIEVAERDEVVKMIAKLPANGADAAAVKAARDAFNALSREMQHSIQCKDGGYYAYYSKLVDAEKLVISNVESLKITASSTAKKGSITVKWTVKGDASAADGYQIYRSVKKNSGFGTKPIFTTAKQTYKNTKSLKKGTRYYYKVRAYKVVDGVKYYSDWSNKAYRIAK